MPGVPCLEMMGVETLFSCQVIFISGRGITRGNMERRINNKKQYEGKKSFIIMLLPLPFSLSDSSPVLHCAKPLTRRASSRWINTVAHGFEHTSEAQRRCLIWYLWTNWRQELGGGFFLEEEGAQPRSSVLWRSRASTSHGRLRKEGSGKEKDVILNICFVLWFIDQWQGGFFGCFKNFSLMANSDVSSSVLMWGIFKLSVETVF